MDARQYCEKEILRNGLEVVIRAARPDDAERLLDAFKALDSNSVYMRFFSPKKEFSEAELRRFRETDFDSRVHLLCVVEHDGTEHVIASGFYVKVANQVAEVAFAVEEDYQRLGIAKRLLAHLGKIAKHKGIKTITAEVLANNGAMLGVFKSCGWPMRSVTSGGISQITFDLAPG